VIKKYYQLAKPGIVYSNVMTAAAGYLFASKWRIDFGLFLYLIFGTAFIIASACVFNNYIDRSIDAKMSRTKTRITASGKISSRAVNLYAIILGLIGFTLLTQTNTLTFLIGVVAFFSYVVLYGIAKRKTVHGTLVGTIPGSASLVAGYTAATSHLSLAALLLFLIMLSWQMAHFYSIAIFRLEDYKAASIPVMPAIKGIKTTKIQIITYAVLFTFATISLTLFQYTGLIFLIVMASLGLYWLHKGISGFNFNSDTKWARGMFGASLIVLLVFSAALSFGAVLP
jgi:protoheme IX farnesyltransferase